MLGAHEAAREIPSKAMKHQQRVVVGPMVFTSDFDSGNMGLVALKPDESESEADRSGAQGGVFEYIIDVAPDGGTLHETGFKSWFFFGLSVAEPVELVHSEHSEPSEPGRERRRISVMSWENGGNALTTSPTQPMQAPAPGEGNEVDPDPPALPTIPEEVPMYLTVRNMNNHTKLYSDGYRPWCKKPGDAWRRLPDSPQLDFSMELEEAFAETVYAWPDPQVPLRNLSRSINDRYFPRAGTGLLFRRQLLHRSLQGRRIDLLTISSMPRSKSEEEPDILPQDLPCATKSNCPKFGDRPIIFISARVHPGETPGQFVFLGALRFLLSDDPRAIALRESFQFKMIPILNPDGVACGHYRTNTLGLNLNRHYDKPEIQSHEAIWAVKRCLSLWSKQSRLLFYLDLHGHASKRGCFLFANRMAGPGQGWNSGYARVFQLNSPHFDMEQCEFGDDFEKEFREGIGKHGSGRVAIHRDCRLCNAYTLECNYNRGRMSRPIACPKGLIGADSPAAEVFGEDSRGVSDSRCKELRIAGARAVPRPSSVKATGRGAPQVLPAPGPWKLERLLSAKARESLKDRAQERAHLGSSQDPLAFDVKPPDPHPALALRRRRTLSSDPVRKAHRGEDAKAQPQEATRRACRA
eukprot:Skav216359  [mRNA]  locus=scaffold3700:22582:27761:+ [translate_table: standard]